MMLDLPISLGGNVEEKKEEIKKYFLNTYEFFESLFDIFVDDDVFYLKSEPTRHPMIFYFGHTATFFVNKLMVSGFIDKRVDAKFEATFAIGVDEMKWDDMDSKHYSWPSVDEVKEYRVKVKKFIIEFIDKLDFTLPIKQDDPLWIIMMGIEHERIHIETSTVLHKQLDLKYIKDNGELKYALSSDKNINNELIDIKGETISLGKGDSDLDFYGWDNEYGKKDVTVEDFKVSKFLVSNGDFLEFIEDGAYENAKYWDDEGLKFLEQLSTKLPVFWEKVDGVYKYRELTKLIDLPLNRPVEVNNLEAKAYCNYLSEKSSKNLSLISEEQWEVLYKNYTPNRYIFDQESSNINFKHFYSTCDVDRFNFNGIYDVVGNVWQHTSSLMDGFKGFKVHKAYDDFSVPTFDAKHNIIKGGSWASSGNEITKHSRYAFRRHFYQFAGIRYVENKTQKTEEINIYESDELISQYCEFQYGDEKFGVTNFAKECATQAIEHSNSFKNALDIGCATGRTSFELAKKFENVVGIDFSTRFIQVGQRFIDDGKIAYVKKGEGELFELIEKNLEEFGFEDIKDRVEFWQGDACNLKDHFCSYDLILATNLIDRLYDPKLFLDDVAHRLNENGVLILTSPYTWLEDFTPKDKWLGGFKDENGEDVLTLDTLKKVLNQDFEFVEAKDVDFVIAETQRKHQHTISQMSVWKKR